MSSKSSKSPRSPNTQAREAVLQMLYALELGGQDAARVERWYLDAHPLAPAVRARAHQLLTVAAERNAELDELIVRNANGWKLARISPIDRSLLKLGAAELIEGRVARRTIFRDGLQLAERFTQAEALPFVHGVLEAIAQEITGEVYQRAEQSAENATP